MTDLPATIDAIVRREPDRAGAAIVAELTNTHVIVERGRWDRVREYADAVYSGAAIDPQGTTDYWRVASAALALQPGDLARDAPGGE